MANYNSLTAKCDLKLSPESTLDPEMDHVLRSFFSGSLVDALQKSGGNLSISIVAGAGKRKKDDKIDESFVKYLGSFDGDEKELRERLEPLLTRQLFGIAKRLKIPLRSGAASSELVNGIVSFVLSSKKWTGISGKSPTLTD
jgi:hypothetical protein